MKKILTICASALLFAACNSDKELDTKKDVVLTDTAGMYKSNYSTDVSNPADNQQQAAPVQQTKVIRETRVVYVDRTPRAPKQTVREASPVVNEPVATVPAPTTSTIPTPAPTQTAGTGNGVGIGTGTSNGTGAGTETSQTQEKKGWSNAAKDAVIGGVVGGVGGAIISKKKGKGAIIGGIIGAAGGYILGKKKDKANEANNINQYSSY